MCKKTSKHGFLCVKKHEAHPSIDICSISVLYLFYTKMFCPHLWHQLCDFPPQAPSTLSGPLATRFLNMKCLRYMASWEIHEIHGPFSGKIIYKNVSCWWPRLITGGYLEEEFGQPGYEISHGLICRQNHLSSQPTLVKPNQTGDSIPKMIDN